MSPSTITSSARRVDVLERGARARRLDRGELRVEHELVDRPLRLR